MLRYLTMMTMMLAVGGLMMACSDYKESGGMTAQEREMDRIADARDAIEEFKDADPTMDRFFDTAYAYAVFPEVGKGAFVVGGAYGKGVVFRNGNAIGFATLKAGSVGAQIGGQSFREIVFFEDQGAFREFRNDRLEFSANASAVAATKGASAAADYDSGVAVFSQAIGGAMLEASIGGQSFDYEAR
jgi:lipid-binding SYLF domain-containing protein